MRKVKFQSRFICLLFILFASCFNLSYAQKIKWNKVKVLVYIKNGKGYIHDNIANSVTAIQALGKEKGFTVDVSDDPAKFTDDNLKQYDALIFSNTNNDVFDTDMQRVALMRYIQAGGNFVGLHSACGTERSWKWFKGLLGGTFFWHEPGQGFSVNVLDQKNPSLAHLPEKWAREKDEFYFLKEMSVNLNVLAVNDHTSIQKPGGKALANAKVNVLSKSGAVLTSTNTDSAGKYTVQGLATGSYRLQFNGRQYVGPYESDAAARDYAWSYWGSSSGSWAKAASIAVKQQGKKTAPSVKTNVNSVVTAGTLVTLTLATANAGGQINVERIISGKVFDRETVYAPLSTDGKSASVRLAVGTYILGSPYTEGSNKPLKYFTGNGKKLTSDRNKAVLVTVSGSSLTLTAGAAG